MIVLTPMSPGRDAQFAEMLDEFRAAGELHVYKGLHAVAWQGYAPFFELLTRMKAGGDPEPHLVPMDSYFIEEDGRILGEVYIRHRLSPSLRKIGGHIGYKVRPSERNRGVATQALRLGLRILHAMKIPKALVTCAGDNHASARVIEKCGGRRIADSQTKSGLERRYWVPTREA